MIVCWIFSDKTEAIAKTFFTKYLTELRMNVKNMVLHYWFPEVAKVKFSEIRSVVFLQCILLVCDVKKSAVDNIPWQIIADWDTRICWKWYEVVLLYNISVLLKTISRDTKHVTNVHKQCQNFAEKFHTTSHRPLTEFIQNHGNWGKRAKKSRRRGWTWSRKVLMC